MREITLGQYYPVNSPVHRLDARIKLLVSIIYIVMLFFVRHFIVFGVIAALLIGVIIASRVPLLKVLKSLKIIIFLSVFVMIMTVFFYKGEGELLWSYGIVKIYKEAIVNALFLLVRLVLLVLGPTMLTYTTTPVELTAALESLLKPLTKIGIPVGWLTVILQLALRLIPTFIEETDKIINAQKSRCADFDSGNIIKKAKAMIPVLIPLMVSAFRRADDLSDAMDSRCYNGPKGRTQYKKLKMRFCDVVVLIVALLILAALLAIAYNWLPTVFAFTSAWWFV